MVTPPPIGSTGSVGDTVPTSPEIAIIVGTRPEIIKLAVLSKLLGERSYLVHSGQHFDENLSGAFFTSFGLQPPRIDLDGVGGSERTTQFSRILEQLGRHFAEQRPGAVAVQGDTNTAAAAAQAAHFAGIPVVHIEAGLRSRDRAMPEEINRMLIGVVADHHCAPTDEAADNLRRSGVNPSDVTVTGNTVVEATLESLPTPEECETVLASHGVQAGCYALATIHRPENTDDPRPLDAILTELAKLAVPVVFPAHPRTRAAAAKHDLTAALDRLNPVEPLGYREFLALAKNARVLISDSGGIQEECTILKKPLVVVRNSTERPEAIESGFAHLVQPGPAIAQTLTRILDDAELPERLAETPSPYGDGMASWRIAAIVQRLAR